MQALRCPVRPAVEDSALRNKIWHGRGRWLFRVAGAGVVLAAVAALATTMSATLPSQERAVPPEAFRPVDLPPATMRPARADAAEELPPTDLVRRLRHPAAPAAPPPGPTHTVRSGDTLWQIAQWHRVDVDVIVRWNEGVDPRRLLAGQQILVPGGGPMPARPARTATSSAGSTLRGGHLWPLPIRGLITTRFSSAHPGIDIAAPAGTTIRAIAGGTVTWAGWTTTGGGYVVVIRHADGMTSRYLHSRRLTVRTGDVVAAGQKIAEVGSTGRSTGPHLDIRITMGGALVDPLRLNWTR